MCIRVARYIQRSSQLILADVVAECSVHGLLTTEHDRTCGISVAVIVLVNSSVCPVSIPCLSVTVSVEGIQVVVALVILEYRIFTFPRPDTCRHTLCTGCRIVCGIHLTGAILSNIVLNQRFVRIHGCDSIATCALDVVILDHHVCGTIFFCDLIRNLCTGKLGPCICISCCDTPAVCGFHTTVLNHEIVKFGNTGCALIIRFLYDKVDTTICHMFVVNVSVYIMYIQIIQNDVIDGSFVLSHTGHTGSVHNIKVIICFAVIVAFLSVVCQFQAAYFDILYIFQ